MDNTELICHIVSPLNRIARAERFAAAMSNKEGRDSFLAMAAELRRELGWIAQLHPEEPARLLVMTTETVSGSTFAPGVDLALHNVPPCSPNLPSNIRSWILKDGPETETNKRHSRPASSFVGRPNRSKSNSTRAGPSNGNQNAQYLQLARTEAVNGNTVGAENYCQHARLDVATPPDHTA
jgi:hypothetical protein